MKRIITLFTVLILCLLSIQAQRVIALQNGSKSFFHQQLDTIMAHAEQGDTIYLPGTNYNYGKDFSINKELHIFGVGHVPDSTKATGFSGILNNIRFITGSDNSTLSGIYINANIYFGTNTTNRNVSNVTISRCNVGNIYLNYNSNVSNSQVNYININENVIRSMVDGGYTPSNIAVERNIINDYVVNFNFPENCYFKNNTILDYSYFFSNVSGVLIENNICLASNPMSGLNQSTLRNNLFSANLDITNDAIGTNSMTGNLVNIARESIFVNAENLTSGFNYDYNYRLKPDCPGKNGGTDGMDIGIYGSDIPYKDVPENPHIISVDNASNVINGKLGVNVIVEAQPR